MRPAVFTVDTFSAGQGQVTVYLDHPDGTREEVTNQPSSGLSLYVSVVMRDCPLARLMTDQQCRGL